MGTHDETDIDIALPFPDSTIELLAGASANRLTGVSVTGKRIETLQGADYQWTITFRYALWKRTSHSWWALYRGVMPGYPDTGKYETWGACSQKSGNAEARHTVAIESYDPPGITNQAESQGNSVFTLALYADESRNEYRLVDFASFRLSPTHGSADDDVFTEIVSHQDHVDFGYRLSTHPTYQWAAVYRGVAPDRAWERKYEVSEWMTRFGPSDSGSGHVDFTGTKGAIYSLVLYRDAVRGNYDIGAVRPFRAIESEMSAGDLLSNPRVVAGGIDCEYKLSADPVYQWYAVYRGVMPHYAFENSRKVVWDWIWTERSGRLAVRFPANPGEIHTLALYKDCSKNAYDLADFRTFRAQ
jgi:hypothetical protein